MGAARAGATLLAAGFGKEGNRVHSRGAALPQLRQAGLGAAEGAKVHTALGTAVDAVDQGGFGPHSHPDDIDDVSSGESPNSTAVTVEDGTRGITTNRSDGRAMDVESVSTQAAGAAGDAGAASEDKRPSEMPGLPQEFGANGWYSPPGVGHNGYEYVCGYFLLIRHV